MTIAVKDPDIALSGNKYILFTLKEVITQRTWLRFHQAWLLYPLPKKDKQVTLKNEGRNFKTKDDQF